MDVSVLIADNAEALVASQPYAAILYYSPGDSGLREILHEFESVARSFDELIAFGTIDLSAPANAEFIEQQVVVVTPTVIYYRFGNPAAEDIGFEPIMERLDHDSIVWYFGHTDTGFQLLR